MLRTALAAWILTGGYLAAQTVEGRVINAATGNGIPDVAVGLLGSGQVDYRATTDAMGHFHIEGVKDGSYLPFYNVPDFSATSGAARQFQVTAGAGPVELEFKMFPKSKLSGRVLDSSGKPVANATVMAAQADAGVVLVFDADAKGEYSAPEGLRPGAWILAAAAPSSWTPPEPRDEQRLGWAKTYYPGVTDAALASPVQVALGSDLRHLDIKLAAVPVHRIRGVVLDDGGNAVPKVAVLLSSRIMETPPSSPQMTNPDDGTFEFESVPSGEYRLSTTLSKEGVNLWASRTVQMKDRDLEDMTLRLTRPFTIQGRVIMEVAEGQTAPKPPRVTMEHADMSAGFLDFLLFASPSSPPPVPNGSGVFDVSPNGNGAFTFQNVYPAEYLITPGFAPPGYYLDSVRLGAGDALAPNVQILSGAEPITITYKRDGGTVRGSVEDCAAGTVVLIPRELARRRDGFIRQTTCGQNGHFEIPAVRPGEYYGFAVAKDGPNVRSLELDQTVINQSVRVSVRAGEATDAEIRLIAR